MLGNLILRYQGIKGDYYISESQIPPCTRKFSQFITKLDTDMLFTFFCNATKDTDSGLRNKPITSRRNKVEDAILVEKRKNNISYF